MNLELVGVEDKLAEAIILGDFGIDGDGSFVTKAPTELEIVERNGVMRWFDPVEVCVSFELI